MGLFRKSGVKSRIQALRQMNESSPENVNYEDQSAYDVADMVKQFFRDLPEPLLTSKLGETFLQIYQCKYTNLLASIDMNVFLFSVNISAKQKKIKSYILHVQMCQRTKGCKQFKQPLCWCQMKTEKCCRHSFVFSAMSPPLWRKIRWHPWTLLCVWPPPSSIST